MVHSIFCQFELKDINGKEITHYHDDNSIVIKLTEEISDKDVNNLWGKFKKLNEHKGGELIFLTPKYEIHKK